MHPTQPSQVHGNQFVVLNGETVKPTTSAICGVKTEDLRLKPIKNLSLRTDLVCVGTPCY
jgi:hypothetical protein